MDWGGRKGIGTLGKVEREEGVGSEKKFGKG